MIKSRTLGQSAICPGSAFLLILNRIANGNDNDSFNEAEKQQFRKA